MPHPMMILAGGTSTGTAGVPDPRKNAARGSPRAIGGSRAGVNVKSGQPPNWSGDAGRVPFCT
jgi:hypothetical protein